MAITDSPRQNRLIGSRGLCGAINRLMRKGNSFSTSLKTRNPVKESTFNLAMGKSLLSPRHSPRQPMLHRASVRVMHGQVNAEVKAVYNSMVLPFISELSSCAHMAQVILQHFCVTLHRVYQIEKQFLHYLMFP